MGESGMSSPVSRVGDTISVHECGVVPTAANGSPNVFTNNIATHRQGDSNTSHPFLPPLLGCPTHVTTLSAGSSSVFANGKGIARVGDSYGCGISLTSGSQNVFSG
jgi:uncharacterized Zn-binding protein involved in type VI secretion